MQHRNISSVGPWSVNNWETARMLHIESFPIILKQCALTGQRSFPPFFLEGVAEGEGDPGPHLMLLWFPHGVPCGWVFPVDQETHQNTVLFSRLCRTQHRNIHNSLTVSPYNIPQYSLLYYYRMYIDFVKEHRTQYLNVLKK